MAYQAPTLYFLHVLRTAGNGNVTITGTEETDFGQERLLDDQKLPLFKWDAGQANHSVTIDQGAAPTGNQRSDTLIIPSGHNLTGTVQVRESSDDFSASDDLVHTFTAAAGLIEETFSTLSENTLQYIRVIMLANAQWEIPELVLTRARTPTAGITSENFDRPVPNFADARMVTGSSFRTSKGAQVRQISMIWDRIEGTDATIFDDLVTETAGGINAFWLVPVDDGKTTVHVKIVELVERENSSPNPQGTGIQDEVRLEMREALE